MRKANKDLYIGEINRLIDTSKKSKSTVDHFSIAKEIFNEHIANNSFENMSAIMVTSLIPIAEQNNLSVDNTKILNKLTYLTILSMLEAAKTEGKYIDNVLILLASISENNFADFIDDTTGYTILHELCKYLDSGNVHDLFEQCSGLQKIINTLDNSGNSALHYMIENIKNINGYIFTLMNHYKLRYIKNNKEVANKFHIAAKIGLDLELDKLNKNDINAQDLYLGKTALHYALDQNPDCISNENVSALLDAGANFLIKDKSGKSPLDYAILYGHIEHIERMLSGNMGDIIDSDYTRKESTQSYIAAAAYSYKKESMALIKSKMDGKFSTIDNLLIEFEKILSSKKNTENKMSQFLDKLTDYTPEQRLIFIFSAGNNFFLNEDDYPENIINTTIVKLNEVTKLTLADLRDKNIVPFRKKGTAYGIELEMANIPEILSTNISSEYLTLLFPIQLVQDNSVQHNLMLKSDLKGNEFVSKILDTHEKAADFLTAIKYLHESQAMTNPSTGMHIHVNIRGNPDEELSSIAASITDDPLEFEEVELNIVKQILVNWSQLEPLLQGFMRSGDMYDLKSTDEHYAAPWQTDINKFLASNTIDEMVALTDYNRYRSLNITSIQLDEHEKSHGTLEFRMHEGTTDPIIIKAWLNFIDRLVSISVDQVKNNNNQFTNKPYPNIEDLSYILIWERDYNKTWSKDSGTPHTAAIPAAQPDKKGKTMQEEIQESEFYKALDGFHLYKAKQKNNTDYKQKDLLRIVELLKAYPGVFPRKPVHKKSKKDEPGVLHRKNSLH